MAIKAWSIYTCTGDGSTADTVVDTNLGYERFLFSLLISNYEATNTAVVWVHFTTSADVTYFKFKRSIAAGALDPLPYKMAINNGDKIVVVSDQVNVSVLASGDETYVG